MTAPPDDLVAQLRDWNEWGCIATALYNGREPKLLLTAADRIATLTAENKALREALRDLAIDSAGFETATGRTWQQCLVCACKWATGGPEEHTDGCLAAGAANER